jgi:3-hydroxyacyl-[acyl-carrier-protein] dehydratase
MRLEYFEMIDRIVHLDHGRKEVEAQSRVPSESSVFEGHFPHHPLVPGVLLTETMAQASGFLLLALGQFTAMPFLMIIDRARFRTFVGPGADLVIRARLDQEGSGYMATAAEIRIDSKLICDALLRFRMLPFPAGTEDDMRERARTVGLLPEAV